MLWRHFSLTDLQKCNQLPWDFSHSRSLHLFDTGRKRRDEEELLAAQGVVFQLLTAEKQLLFVLYHLHLHQLFEDTFTDANENQRDKKISPSMGSSLTELHQSDWVGRRSWNPCFGLCCIVILTPWWSNLTNTFKQKPKWFFFHCWKYIQVSRG